MQINLSFKQFFLIVALILIALLGLGYTSEQGQAAWGFRAQAQLSPATLQAKVDAYQQLLPKAQRDGEVRLILGLNVKFKPEGQFASGLSVRVQRYFITRRQAAVEERLKPFNARVVRQFKFVPYMAVLVDVTGLAELVDNPDVLSLQEDVPSPPSLTETIPIIGANAAWSTGYTGAGQTIAILDTGVESGHDFLGGKVVAEACFSTGGAASTSLCPDGSNTQLGPGAAVNCSLGISGCDHGTHVAGIAVGNGTSFSGVAKDASILVVQVFSKFTGSQCTAFGLPSPCILTYTSDQMAALEWVYDQRSSFNIAAVNMSLGSGQFASYCDGDTRKPAIDNLRSEDIATVISSGNGSYRTEISAPACISSAISVGATTDADIVASYSNVASFISLLSPGSSVVSSVPGNAYGSKSGTSMAAPHVSGAWAIMKSKDPTATVDDVLAALQTTGVLIDDLRASPSGSVTDMPRIQIDDALALLVVSTPTSTPTATDTPTATSTPTSTSTATSTPTNTATSTPTDTAMAVDTATATSTGTSTSTPTNTATSTATATATNTPISTPTAIFEDVPFGHWAFDYINALYNAGYIAGCSADPRLYCPDRILNRAESSVFVLRGQYGSIPDPPHASPATATFADVDPGHWKYGWIESLWADGYTAGCGNDPLIYCPLRQHTRAEGSVFFLRIKNGVGYVPPAAVGIFEDVSLSAWYPDWVEAAYNEGILPACETDPLRFCPEQPLDRAWAAYMMVQAKGGLPLSTQASLPAESVSSFDFTIAGDMRAYAGPGDYDTAAYFRGAVEAIADRAAANFMISTGDMDPILGTYWTIQDVLGESYLWYPVLGNHDTGQEDLSWLQMFDRGAVNPGPSGCPRTTYSFDHGNVHFVILNVYCDLEGPAATDGDVTKHLYDWLESDLNATNKEHVFVFGHEPAYPQPDADNGSLRHLGGSLDANPDNRNRFWRLLREHGVVFYACGHTHGFSAVRIQDVWQLDAGHAQGIGFADIPSTFIIISVDGDEVSYQTYRDDGDGGPYQLIHWGVFN